MLSSEAHALFLDGLNGIARSAGKVKVPTYGLLRGGLISKPAKGVIVQIVSAFIVLAAKSFVGLFKVETGNCQ